jgi:D-glycero-D-manno-heptose 1,7-bisphosphate phosphatase
MDEAGQRPRAVALLDRDGTINVKPPEGAWVTRPDELVVLDGAVAAVRRLNDAGVPVAVVSNQRGIDAGVMTESDLAAVNARLAGLLAAEGAHVDLWLHCPHGRVGCDCRKPRPGMLLEALEHFGADAAASVMVGDAVTDVAAAQAAGVPALRVGPAGEVPTLAAAVDRWLAERGA